MSKLFEGREAMLRLFLYGNSPQYREVQEHFCRNYPNEIIDICYEQQIVEDETVLFTFLVTLPPLRQSGESHYLRRMFLSRLPIVLRSVVHWQHVNGPDTPIDVVEVRKWLVMTPEARMRKREWVSWADAHYGIDVPLHYDCSRLDT